MGIVHCSRSSRWLLAAALALAAVGLPGAAWAQDQPPRPHYQGIFASAPPASRELGVKWSALGVYDDNVTADTASFDPRLQVNGLYWMGAATLTYSENTKRHQFTATGRTTTRYYPDMSELNATEGSGDVGLVAEIGRRSRVTLFQGATYQPYYQMDFLGATVPSEGVVVGDGSSVGPPQVGGTPLHTLTSYIYDGRYGWSTGIGRSGTLSTEYTYRRTIFDDGRQPFDWQLADVKFTRKMTRYAALRLGYGYGYSQSTTRVENQNIDVGLDYARPLSRTRRTKINFSSGSSVINYLDKQYFVVNGDAGLTHEIGRSWTVNLDYHRGVQYAEAVAGPMMADTVHTRFEGYLSRRIEANVHAAYSSGQIGLGSTDPGYSTFSAGSALRIALNHVFSVDVQYLFDQYDFDHGAPVLVGIPRTLERHSVRIGVTGWVPLLRSIAQR